MHRTANALIMALGAITILAGLAISLSDLTVGRFQEQISRRDQVLLMAGAESAANEAIDWMRSQSSTVLKTMPAHPEVVQAVGATTPRSAQQQYEFLATLPATDVVDSAALSASLPAMLPALPMTSGAQIPGCGSNMRSGAGVQIKIVCIKQTEAGNTWPDGFEKFLVFATATQGDTDKQASKYRRARVEAVISTSSAKVFKQAFFARQKYTVTGNMSAHSWAGNGAAITPKTAVTSGNGQASSGDTVTTGGSAAVDKIKNDVNMALPPVVYSPAAGASALGNVTTTTTLAGGTNYRATNVTGDLKISGSGTISLWVDNAFSLSNITWNAGATADVIIYQSPNATAASGLDIKANNSIGYLQKSGSGAGASYAPVPSKLMIISGFKGDWSMNGNGEFSGLIYAPYANVKMNGTASLFGAIISDSFDSKVNGTFNFWYDDTVGQISLPLDPQLSASGWNQYYPGFAQQ